MSYTTMIELMKTKRKLIEKKVQCCDCCGNKDYMYFDGPTANGRFAYMCGVCYLTEGQANFDLLNGPTTVLVESMSNVKDNPFSKEIKEIVELRSPLLYKELKAKSSKKSSALGDGLNLSGDTSSPFKVAGGKPNGIRNMILNSPAIEFMKGRKLAEPKKKTIREFINSIGTMDSEILENLITVIGFTYGTDNSYAVAVGTNPSLLVTGKSGNTKIGKGDLSLLFEVAKNLNISNYHTVKTFVDGTGIGINSATLAERLSGDGHTNTVFCKNNILFVFSYDKGIIKRVTVADIQEEYINDTAKLDTPMDWAEYFLSVNNYNTTDSVYLRDELKDYSNESAKVEDGNLIFDCDNKYSISDIRAIIKEKRYGKGGMSPEDKLVLSMLSGKSYDEVDNNNSIQDCPMVNCESELPGEEPVLKSSEENSKPVNSNKAQELLNSIMSDMVRSVLTNISNLEYLSEEENNSIDLEQLIELEESFKISYEKLNKARKNFEGKSGMSNFGSMNR